MLATAFSKYSPSDKLVLFASGVSNSGCVDNRQFFRESSLLSLTLDSLHPSQTLVYFSTCSIYDSSLSNNPYIEHKLEMEALLSTSPQSLVVRLPQLVGSNASPTTLVRYLVTCIRNEEPFALWINAFRNIIDVDDVAQIVLALMKDSVSHPKILNIANPVSVSVREIVACIEDVVGKRAIATYVDAGTSYHINTEYISPILEDLSMNFSSDYLPSVIAKYYS